MMCIFLGTSSYPYLSTASNRSNFLSSVLVSLFLSSDLAESVLLSVLVSFFSLLAFGLSDLAPSLLSEDFTSDFPTLGSAVLASDFGDSVLVLG